MWPALTQSGFYNIKALEWVKKKDKGKTMIISHPTRRISMFSLSKAFRIFADQLGCIIEIFHIIPPVLFWAVAGLANKIFNSQTLTSCDCLLVEQAVDLKRSKSVSITIDKHGGRMMWVKVPKRVVKKLGSRLKLRYQENRVDFLVVWYYEPITKAFYFFLYLKWANVLLG